MLSFAHQGSRRKINRRALAGNPYLSNTTGPPPLFLLVLRSGAICPLRGFTRSEGDIALERVGHLLVKTSGQGDNRAFAD